MTLNEMQYEYLVGKVSGAVSGLTVYILQMTTKIGFISWNSIWDFLFNLIPAGATALICGFLGAMGTRIFHYIRKKYLEFKSKRK